MSTKNRRRFIPEQKLMKRFYHDFRYEIDSYVFPLAEKEVQGKSNSTMHLIDYKTESGRTVHVGFLYVRNGYADSLYIKPKYRRLGIGTKAVRDYLAEGGVIKTLDIINSNNAALHFWNKIFDLEKCGRDDVETRYKAVGVKQ